MHCRPAAAGPLRRGASVWGKQSQPAVGMQSSRAVEPQGGTATPKPTSRLGFTRGPHQNLWNYVPGPIGQLKDTREGAKCADTSMWV